MAKERPVQPSDPAARPGGILCPYCGHVSMNPRRCEACSGHFDPLSRQASQNGMGPWFIRDTANPFRPGCSYETLKELIRRKKIQRNTVLRGPSTRQFWSFAGRTPSVANLLGICHNCQAAVDTEAFACQACGAAFSPDTDRQHLGLAPVHLLPGQATPEMIAATASAERAGDGDKQAPSQGSGNAGAWIAGGGAALLVIAGSLFAVLWALRVPSVEVAAQGPTPPQPAATPARESAPAAVETAQAPALAESGEPGLPAPAIESEESARVAGSEKPADPAASAQWQAMQRRLAALEQLRQLP